MKVGLWAKWKWFRAVSWGYGKFWHLSSLDGTRFRPSKLRLGTGAMSRSRVEAAGLTVQIESMYEEMGGLKAARDMAHLKGQLQGWEQHQEVVEKYIDDAVQKAKD